MSALAEVVNDELNEDLDAITQSLANTMIERQLTTKTMLMGMHAFLMALEAGGHAEAGEVSEELHRMAEYYGSLVVKH